MEFLFTDDLFCIILSLFLSFSRAARLSPHLLVICSSCQMMFPFLSLIQGCRPTLSHFFEDSEKDILVLLSIFKILQRSSLCLDDYIFYFLSQGFVWLIASSTKLLSCLWLHFITFLQSTSWFSWNLPQFISYLCYHNYHGPSPSCAILSTFSG